MKRLFMAALVAMVPALAAAAPPQVMADILPVEGLVARVMDGVGKPALLVPPGASPHDYALKPSQAKALAGAQAVFMVGPELTPWLSRPIESLAPNVNRVQLLDAPGTQTLASRTGATFDLHEPASAEDDHDHAHHHGGIDPHAWLDPENGKAWTRAIAAELSRIDPDNAARYAANADAAVAEIDAAETDTAAALKPLSGARFLAFHDAFQYLEHRFGIAAAGAVSASDAATPGPRRIADLGQAIADSPVTCVLAEPQFDPDLLASALDGTAVPTVVIDPLGTAIASGSGHYPALIREMGKALQDCGEGGR